MFQFLRSRRLPSQWLAALLLLVWLTPLVVPHAADDDLLCVPVSASPDSPVRVAAVNGAARQAHHCVICHSIRSFRTALADCGPAAVTLTAEHGIDARADASHRLPAFDWLPARAPPA